MKVVKFLILALSAGTTLYAIQRGITSLQQAREYERQLKVAGNGQVTP